MRTETRIRCLQIHPRCKARAMRVFLYYLIAPSNASKTINVTWSFSQVGSENTIFADEFSGQAAFDKDVAGSGTSGTAINQPTIVPTKANELLYAGSVPFTNNNASPTNGATQGVWTGCGGGINASSGASVEYDLSASSSTAVNFTQSSTGGAWAAMVMAFSILVDTVTETLQYQLY